MVVNYAGKIWQGAIANFDVAAVKKLTKFVKCLSRICKSLLPILVVTYYIPFSAFIWSYHIILDQPHHIGPTKNTFKHKNSFKCETKNKSTELSNYVWDKKKDKQEIPLQQYIKEKPKHIHLLQKDACLCLNEKFHIFFS